MVGGGEGSQIGPVHLMAARLDGAFDFVAGALDHRPDAGRAYGERLGLAPERAYGDWREMLAGETARADGVELVTVATPNAAHYEIAKAFLEAGVHVLVEKPMTTTVDEARDLAHIARDQDRICAVNYGYSGYPLVREMRSMIAEGKLGAIRLVVAEFAHGHHANAEDAENPRVRWRYDPAEAGASAQFADCGIHALHLATFVTGARAARLSADFAACVPGRQLEDDAMVDLRFDTGAVGRIWTSSVAIGRQHGLSLQVFGETGGLCWSQERPDQLYWTPLGGRTQIIERGGDGLSYDAVHANRITVGHAEGFPFAVANIYADLASAIRGGTRPELYPTALDGLASMQAIDAAVASAGDDGRWIDIPEITL